MSSLVIGVGLTACGPEDKSSGKDTEGDSEGDTDDGTGADSAGTAGDDGSGGADGSTFDTGGADQGGTTGSDEPGPNGSNCVDGDDCQSGFCYDVPMLGGICSECLTDADCMTNGEPGSCAFDLVGMFAVCTMGEKGDMCMTDEACQDGLLCAELIDTGGVFPANSCSDCKTDGDCMNGQLCSPVWDVASFGGYQECVDPSSVPDGSGCPVDMGAGDGSVCASGYCGVADVFGLSLGVCGECDPVTGAGCGAMMNCQAPTVDLSGFVPATCTGGTGGTTGG